jgi:hypothetical protein
MSPIQDNIPLPQRNQIAQVTAADGTQTSDQKSHDSLFFTNTGYDLALMILNIRS